MGQRRRNTVLASKVISQITGFELLSEVILEKAYNFVVVVVVVVKTGSLG